MNQRERMLAGLPYKAWLDGLTEERTACRQKIYDFNMLPPKERKKIPEMLKDIIGKTGENIWIEAPFQCDYGWNIEVGVTIGNNVIIGAGSVVSKNIPDNMIAVGNPCRVIREITEEDRKYYYKNREFDVPIE